MVGDVSVTPRRLVHRTVCARPAATPRTSPCPFAEPRPHGSLFRNSSKTEPRPSRLTAGPAASQRPTWIVQSRRPFLVDTAIRFPLRLPRGGEGKGEPGG